jgi:hypothetical protein
MRYILIDEQRRRNAINELQGLDISKLIEVTIKPHKKNRSNSQNNLMWMWLPDIARHFGYTEDELHELLKVRFLGIEEKIVDGRTLIQPISTTKLTTKQMAEYLTKIEILARANNIRLKIPDDYKFAMLRT